MKGIRQPLLLLVIIFAAGFALNIKGIRSGFRVNTAALHAVDAILGGEAEDDTEARAEKPCSLIWYDVQLAHSRAALEDADVLVESIIDCDPLYIPFVRHILPDHEALARYAAAVHSSEAEAWFWLANIRAASQEEEIRSDGIQEIEELYRKGLSLRPEDGRRWLELADVLRTENPDAAIDAYLQACFLGDPGFNACYRAGNLAEDMGDIAAAITYYRYSKWQSALDRADRLEMQQRAP